MQSATTTGSPATASIQLKQLVYPLHGAEFAVGDLAGAQSFSSLGTHSGAVSRGLVGHHTRACGFHAVGLGFHDGFPHAGPSFERWKLLKLCCLATGIEEQ